MKDRVIQELQDKIDTRERQLSKLEKENRELEQNLRLTNEKRFKLQETIGSMEKELQSTKAHVNQLADINTRYEMGMKYSNNDKFPKHRQFEPPHVYPCGHNKLEPLKLRDIAAEVSLNETAFQQNHRDIPNPNNILDDSKKLNSKSLISLSLKQVDFLKTRLNHLTKIAPLKNVESVALPQKLISNQSINKEGDSKNKLNRMVDLTVKRYEYLQKQAYESYEELTSLMKLVLSNHRLTENKCQ